LFQISKALAFLTEPKFVSLVCPLACCAAKHAPTACKAQYAMLKASGEEGKENMPVSNSSGAAQHESLHTMQGQDFTMHSWKA